MTGISNRLDAVRARIYAAAQRAGRDPASIQLLAVSKTWPVTAIAEAAAAGQTAFGENYVQEGVDKIVSLSAHKRLEWHFIGPLQSNKTRQVAEHFDWVHTVDRFKIAQRLAQQRPHSMAPLNICIQINISGEASKSGVALSDAETFARQVNALPGVCLRGFMTIPEPSDDLSLLHSRFAALRNLRDVFNAKYALDLDTLSMGMSHDLEAAIIEGATIVRVGTAIFGARGG